MADSELEMGLAQALQQFGQGMQTGRENVRKDVALTQALQAQAVKQAFDLRKANLDDEIFNLRKLEAESTIEANKERIKNDRITAEASRKTADTHARKVDWEVRERKAVVRNQVWENAKAYWERNRPARSKKWSDLASKARHNLVSALAQDIHPDLFQGETRIEIPVEFYQNRNWLGEMFRSMGWQAGRTAPEIEAYLMGRSFVDSRGRPIADNPKPEVLPTKRVQSTSGFLAGGLQPRGRSASFTPVQDVKKLLEAAPKKKGGGFLGGTLDKIVNPPKTLPGQAAPADNPLESTIRSNPEAFDRKAEFIASQPPERQEQLYRETLIDLKNSGTTPALNEVIKSTFTALNLDDDTINNDVQGKPTRVVDEKALDAENQASLRRSIAQMESMVQEGKMSPEQFKTISERIESKLK